MNHATEHIMLLKTSSIAFREVLSAMISSQKQGFVS